jgi:hypothetical protein
VGVVKAQPPMEYFYYHRHTSLTTSEQQLKVSLKLLIDKRRQVNFVFTTQTCKQKKAKKKKSI